MIQTSCPSCGAPLTFQASHSILAVCGYCRSTILRKDLDLSVIGKMAEVREDHSPLQVGARGSFHGSPFRIVGRLQVRYDAGFWSEWYVLLADGREGWLSESNGRLAMMFEERSKETLPSFQRTAIGENVALESGSFVVTERQVARVIGAEGELPSHLEGGWELPFVDLATPTGRFGTIDYSDDAPRAYVGPFVRLRDLAMTGLRQFGRFASGVSGATGEPVDVASESFSCPSCGGSIEVHVPQQTQSYGCIHCGALLSVEDERVALLERWRATVEMPTIPIGSVGELDGVSWEVLGAVRKGITDVYAEYLWWEHLLFNPYEGYRWLVESDGHFTLMETVLGVPAVDTLGARRLQGTRFQLFSEATATTRHVLGELYWRARLGDQAEVADYVAPPRLLSKEGTGVEEVWSVGHYVQGEDVWRAFGLKGSPPTPEGIAPNQPWDPQGTRRRINTSFAWLALILLAAGLFQWFTARDQVLGTLEGDIEPGTTDADATQWSTPLALTGRPGAMEIASQANVSNQWLYLDMSLVEETTGEVRSLSHMLELWSGPDWTEGSRDQTTLVGPLHEGNWTLRVAPDWEKTKPLDTPIHWSVTLTWDPRRYFPIVVGLIVLAIGPLIVQLSRMSFENRRWNQE